MKIVVMDDYADALRRVVGLSRLASHDVTIYVDAATSPAEIVRRLQDAECAVLIQQRLPLSAEIIRSLPKLRLISQTGKNTGHIDIDACNECGIVVSAHGSGAPNHTAELAWGLIIASLRDLPRQIQRLRDGEWLDSIGRTLVGKTLGIYAFGRIGSLVARYGAAFGMRVVCFGREGSTARAREAGFEVVTDRDAFFGMADVLSLHLPLTRATQGIIAPADLARMKPTALIVNTSRAGIIEAGALVEALRTGRPGYAAIDVFETEPVLGGGYPLLHLPNVICTPHLGYSVESAYTAMFDTAIEQILAFAAGHPINVVNAPSV